MQYKKVKNSTLAFSGDTLVPTLSWYQKPVVWISAITAAVGVIGVIVQQFPAYGWLTMVGSILSIVLNTIETTVSSESVISN